MKKRLNCFVPCCLCAFLAAQAAFTQVARTFSLTAEYLEGEWRGGSVLGTTPILRFSAHGNFFSGLYDARGKEHAVCTGTYTISGKVVTETPLVVEDSFYGKASGIKAGKTIMRLTLRDDGTLLSEDAPLASKVVFKKATSP
jgi:hypothetical protein